ncbi:hypothetical protein Tco_0382110 [Tanacetum coccineum]
MNISAVYVAHSLVFKEKGFYINNTYEPSDREAVRSHMRILSVISVKTIHTVGYNKGMSLGSGQDDKEKNKDHHYCKKIREKTTDQKDLSKSRKLCWRKNKRY